MTADCSRASDPAAGALAGESRSDRQHRQIVGRTLVAGPRERRSMARKLKSDKVLFIATLLLVCTSVVMVYSASAVDGAGALPARRTCFLIKQAMWALLGLAVLPIVMRIDYRTYRQPAFIWTALGVVGAGAGRRAVPRAGQRRAALVRRRRHRHPAVGAREARRDLLHRRAARAAHAPHRRARRTRCCRSASSSRRSSALILLEPDFGTSMSLAADRRA